MILSIIARVLNAAVIVYVFLCAARVLMSWVPGLDAGRGGEILARARRSLPHLVPPHQDSSRREPSTSARSRPSPLLAVVNDLLTTVAYAGRLSVGLVLGLLVGAAWSAVAFVISFFAVCAIARMVAYAARWNSLHPLWMVIDSMLNPVLFRINRFIYRGRIVNYLQGLITGFVGPPPRPRGRRRPVRLWSSAASSGCPSEGARYAELRGSAAYLSGLAQSMECLVTLGRAGATPELADRLDELLGAHELVKLRFGDFKESRRELAAALAERDGQRAGEDDRLRRRLLEAQSRSRPA